MKINWRVSPGNYIRQTGRMMLLEELLNAPQLPKNLPPFEIIKECEKVIESDSESGSDSGSESSDTEVEEVFPCECRYEENSSNSEGQACGVSANCINRELFIECDGEECPCRNRCQNQRFQNRQYAQVKVIETPGKGFGLFVCEDLKPGTLVIEYVGEVVNQEQMGTRAQKYAKQGQPHFYFMTLRPNQIIDATCKGNLSRFMNHSCSPNCETQKWIVGGKIKIGLFTLKNIKAGSELTFDYKFVRFGKEPQKCLCGEPNCTSFIGVSSQENSSGRKSKQTEDSEEDSDGVDEFQIFIDSDPKAAELPGQISLIVSKLIQTDDLEVTKKLLKILQSTEKYLCQRKFLNLHGLKLLSSLLTEHAKDSEIVFTILNVLKGLPLSTRNSIKEAGWLEKLELIKSKNSEFSQEIKDLSWELSDKWSDLDEILKVPKKSSTPSNSANLMSVPSEFSSALNRKRAQWDADSESTRAQDRDRDRKGNESKDGDYKSPKKSSESSRSRSPEKKMIPDPMWLTAYAPDGKVYYYHSETKVTSWDVPMIPAPTALAVGSSYREGSRGREDRHDRDNRELDTRSSRDSRGRQRDYRDTRDHNGSRNYNSRDSRDYNSRDSRDYNSRDSRDSRHYGDLRDSRDYRDNYKSDQRNHEHAMQRESVPTTQTPSASLIEGIEDSNQLTAVIERAKARRIRIEDENVNEKIAIEAAAEDEFLTSPISSDGQLHGVDKNHYRKLKEEISGLVIRFLSHYKNELGSDFKSVARKYSHKIIEKELKDQQESQTTSSDPSDTILNTKKKQKIKNYLGEVLKARGIKIKK